MTERWLLYFLLGGTVVSLATVLGSQGKGWLAAFLTLFPAATVITFTGIYLEAGIPQLKTYIQGLLIVLPAWVSYLAIVYKLADRIALLSIPLGIVVYTILSLILKMLLS